MISVKITLLNFIIYIILLIGLIIILPNFISYGTIILKLFVLCRVAIEFVGFHSHQVATQNKRKEIPHTRPKVFVNLTYQGIKRLAHCCYH